MFADIHNHILYGLDDGAQTEEQMYQMLSAAAADGTTILAVTPHISLDTCPFPMETYEKRLKQARHWCAENGIRLYGGSEILYSDGIVNVLRDGEIPTLGGTKSVLVEFSLDVSEDELESAVRRFSNLGFQVVIAHVERYDCMYDLDFAENLRELYPVKYQVNAATVASGGDGFRQKRWLKKMLRGDLVDLIASDAHSTGRRCARMTQAHGALSKKYGAETADRLCYTAPMEILGLSGVNDIPDEEDL